MRPCTYCGKPNEDAALHCCECGTEFAPSPGTASPSESISTTRIGLEAVSLAFSYQDGFHRADWDFVRHWIESHIRPEDLDEAWNEAALIWVSKLREDLGGGYRILQSRLSVLLCDRPLATAQWLLDYAGRTALTIKEHLGDAAWQGGFGKDVILVFSDDDDYYEYLAYHTPDGEQPASGGVCVRSGYTHIAVPWRDELDAANVIVHELTHNCLAHLPLPLWLNEGVAVTLQKGIAPPPRALGQSDHEVFASTALNWSAPIMWEELAERHFAFWTEQNIQSFWAGTSFYQPGESNELSYSLAEVFLKLLTERTDRDAFRAFLDSAQPDDAGQTAAMDLLGIDLGEIAGTFLGQGNWRPQRKAMVQCWEAAGWPKPHGDGGDNLPADGCPDGPVR